MNVDQMQIDDFFEIKQRLKEFWGDRYQLFEQMHHPMLFYEFGKTAYVVKSENKVVAYLLGLLPQTSETAYVHLMAVQFNHRKNKYGSALYDHFISYARAKGYKKVKAITSPTNVNSIEFHRKIGMVLQGDENQEGIRVVRDYSGPGEDRVVFEKQI
jgi:L-amino acid N-acyltransferase YncA